MARQYSDDEIAAINRKAREVANRGSKPRPARRPYVRHSYPEAVAEAIERAERDYWRQECDRAPQGRKPQFPHARHVQSWRTLFAAMLPE